MLKAKYADNNTLHRFMQNQDITLSAEHGMLDFQTMAFVMAQNRMTRPAQVHPQCRHCRNLTARLLCPRPAIIRGTPTTLFRAKHKTSQPQLDCKTGTRGMTAWDMCCFSEASLRYLSLAARSVPFLPPSGHFPGFGMVSAGALLGRHIHTKMCDTHHQQIT